MANIKKIKLVDNSEYDIVDASATHIQEVTLAQWDALTPEQQASGDYVITDATLSPLSASLIPYDNTTSGLTADDVQEAIDEIVGDIPVNATELPISASDTTNAKDYIDTGLSGKANNNDIPTVTDLSSSVTVGSMFNTPNYKKLYKYGNICHLVFRAQLNAQLSDNSSFLTIPSSCTPKGNDYAQIIWTGSQYSAITPKNAYYGSWDSSLHNLGSVSSGTYIVIDTVWITN